MKGEVAKKTWKYVSKPLYKSSERERKVHGGENTFIKRNDACVIPVAYSLILIRTYGSPTRI